MDQRDFILALVTAFLVAVPQIILAWRGESKLNEIHAQYNSRMDEFMELIKKTSREAGHKEGVAAEKAEKAEREED